MPVKRRKAAAKKTPSIRSKRDGATVRRGITIKAPMSEVKRLWKQKDFPGKHRAARGALDEVCVHLLARDRSLLGGLMIALMRK